MNKREEALSEALRKNEDESQRWQTYLKENETAIENMNKFVQRLSIDVMVPVGKKAFMPGCLLHTNEVLIGHYQGYFSKCSTFKATEICDLRIKTAKEHLKYLEIEADLWQNKLDKPYTEGVIPSGDECEIIEEFNEETEKLWKEQHRIKVRLSKQQERKERIAQQGESLNNENTSKKKTNEEIFQMLEEAELMEELEQELNKLELDEVNDETVRKLMSGEMKLPEQKKRKAHDTKNTKHNNTDETFVLSNVVKKIDIREIAQINTNNNVQPNSEIINLANIQSEDFEEMEDEALPEEAILIKEQAKFLNTEDQIGFYDYQIQIIRQKLQLLPLRTQQELDEKIHLLNVLDHLEEFLEAAEETAGAAELDKEIEKDEIIEKEINKGNAKNSNKVSNSKEIVTNEIDNENKRNKKRRISFALEDQTLEFEKHESVTDMLPPLKHEQPQREIIKLNNDNEREKSCKQKNENCLNKLDLIQAKVKKNLQFVEENQSKQDFDLIQQILKSSMGETNTLHISFKHSEEEACRTDKESPNIPGNPAEIYNMYIRSQQLFECVNKPSTIFINSYEGEDEVKVPALKESDRQSAFADPKSEFSNPSKAKSILKNKSDVDKENHYEDIQRNNRNKKSKKKDDCLSAYYKVMNDVVEKPLTEPDPLPDVKFIDAHTPKKRVSRFKQMRQGKT